ncbi:MAG: thermopsin family protease, partial [Thermoplasmata archaeon]
MVQLDAHSRTFWVLPIVIAACALMVLPGATFLAANSQAASALSSRGAGSSALAAAESGPSGSLIPNSLPVPSSASPLSSVLSGLPSSLRQTPWVESLAHQGPSLQPLVSLPNLAFLDHPAPSVSAAVNPFYVAQPAPLGLADYGLGAQTYSYNTSSFLGQLTLTAPPNVTDPASSGVIETEGSHLGEVGNVHEFGVQLNTVATNISIPGSDQAFFWTQNVVDWNDTGIHFVDDTFNFSSPAAYIYPGTIYSGCNNHTSGVDRILYVYGGVFQCVGTTIPVTHASYPVTIQLYNNASINAQKRTQVAYGFRITESGTGKVYTGVSDTVVFNNPRAPHSAPANKPGFSVDGFAPTPQGLLRDAELDLVGDIGGDNSVFRSIHGTVNLDYWSSVTGSYTSVPSAYNFGTDTGESSTGIADYWTPSHTLMVNQGPAMLYGLWNAVPWASVHSGGVRLAGSITPSYGFVFVSNTAPILDPWGTGERDNMSWLPTTNSGAFSTMLPPLGAPWTNQYYVQAFAAGYAEMNGTPVTGATTGYALNLISAPGLLNAPLYMFSNVQAARLADAVTGSSSTPYNFNGLVDNMNFTFDHLNAFGYPTFVLLNAQGVTKPIYVNNTYQGQDSASGNFY